MTKLKLDKEVGGGDLVISGIVCLVFVFVVLFCLYVFRHVIRVVFLLFMGTLKMYHFL